MEDAILEIVAALREGNRRLDAAWLDKLVRRYNRASHDANRRVAKRRLLPFYFGVKANDPARWESWNIDEATERALVQLLRMKPRRTASGVATITVITKPWPCSSDCLYCPNDVRMPKSYLADEPACQRAERNYFDPYLQVRSRLVALSQMGHVVDKVELIVLGGTWNDYPEAYQIWYIKELFRAVNEFESTSGSAQSSKGNPFAAAGFAQPDDSVCDELHAAAFDAPEERDRRYRIAGLTYDPVELKRRTSALQCEVDQDRMTYNQAIGRLESAAGWQNASEWQYATMEELLRQHATNEGARHRVVGLTIETRPDLITASSAKFMRRLGCTKVQMGIQSLDEHILALNHRKVSIAQIEDAFVALRLAGFKIQIHFMANLLGSTPEADKADYLKLVRDQRFLPDEVKLYPCCLVQSSHLGAYYERGDWKPYSEEELMDLLVTDTVATPAYTRISRMIRDISATDIVAGNKKTNLRQMVEARIAKLGLEVSEIRQREVATSDVRVEDLHLNCVPYATTVSDECFLQWVTDDNRIAGFLRLSLPFNSNKAMIREVHVYGRVAAIHEAERGGAQHAGLGRQLVEEACARARHAGRVSISVISSVGTRKYYRELGFADAGLYQCRSLA